jgi:hypothetical protein
MQCLPAHAQRVCVCARARFLHAFFAHPAPFFPQLSQDLIRLLLAAPGRRALRAALLCRRHTPPPPPRAVLLAKAKKSRLAPQIKNTHRSFAPCFAPCSGKRTHASGCNGDTQSHNTRTHTHVHAHTHTTLPPSPSLFPFLASRDLMASVFPLCLSLLQPRCTHTRLFTDHPPPALSPLWG